MLVDRVVDGCMGNLEIFYVELDIRAANFKRKGGVGGCNLPCNLT
jgi:hypothetical protein